MNHRGWEVLQSAATDSANFHPAMGADISHQQMVFRMQELIEITLLDAIFSHQNRIGNIDYLNYWCWVDQGDIKRLLPQYPLSTQSNHSAK